MARKSLSLVMKAIEKELQDFPAQTAFLNDLIKSIELDAQKDHRKGSASYKPSSMTCIRQMFYIKTGAETDPYIKRSFQNIGICNNGTDTHLRIQSAVLRMKDNGIDCEYINVAEFVRQRNLTDLEIIQEPDFEHGEFETKLYHKNLQLSFLCDGIIKYKNVYYVLELKTESSNKFWARNGVDESHYNQGTCYSLAFGIDQVIFVYISRDTYDMKSFMFNVTDEMKADIIGLITNCDNYVTENKVPPKPADPPKKSCMYCEFRERCGKDL